MAQAPRAPPRAGVYFCRQPARCIVPEAGGEKGKHRFIVGTCTLQQRNELHMVEFSEETGDVTCRQAVSHPDEIWGLALSPTDGSQLLTYSTGKGKPAIRLWKLPEQGGSLQELASVDANEAQLSAVKSLLWDPHHVGNVVAADSEALHVFEGSAGGGPLKASTSLQVGQRCSGACLDPHHANQVSTVDDMHLKTWDLRSSKQAFKRDNAHVFGARDVDYNPNVPYQVLTTGEDATLRFWDLRKLDNCLRTLSGGHHHWTVRARYNGHHDQLVLSCGTDSAVCLWRCTSVASAPLGAPPAGAGGPAGDGQGGTPKPSDGLVRRYEEHEDSCYSCCWSPSDAWIFASVAYDGRVVVNRVPGEEKYRILL